MAHSVAPGHSHRAEMPHRHERNERRLFWTATITGGFMLAEAIGGLVSGSLALLADAGHMLADFAGLALAWLAFRFSHWPADRRRTYGFERLQVLVAFGNGLVLFVIAGFIVFEAVRRLLDPVPVIGEAMLAIAVIGLAVNVGVYFVLHGADRTNLNVRGAMVHVIGDLFSSVGTIAAALVIMATGWTAADPLVSAIVAGVILRSAWYVVRDSSHILLEGTPSDVADADIKSTLEGNIAGVTNVHHVHTWSITDERPVVTLHAQIARNADAESVVVDIKKLLGSRFGIAHATVEIERDKCADESVGLAADHHRHRRQPH